MNRDRDIGGLNEYTALPARYYETQRKMWLSTSGYNPLEPKTVEEAGWCVECKRELGKCICLDPPPVWWGDSMEED